MEEVPPGEVTRVLADIRRGDAGAHDRLWEIVYAELRRLAERKMARERRGQTLQPTALVHEAYVRLVGSGDAAPRSWDGRGHFYAAAANAMRRILVDRARHRGRLKRGADAARVALSGVALESPVKSVDLIDLDDALNKLEAIDPAKATLVTLRYLLGCTVEETAEAMGLSEAKIKKDWIFAKAWLRRQLDE